MSADVVDAFREWARATCGVLVPADLPIGKIVHCPVDGKPSSNKAGRAKLHLNGIAAGWAQNWTIDDKPHTWCSKREADCSPAERAAYRAQVQAMQREREATDAKIAREAAALGSRVQDDSPACTGHSYLTDKRVKPHGLRVTSRQWELPLRDGEGVLTIPSGALVLPLRDSAGKLHSLQFIYIDDKGKNQKRFLPGGEKRGHYHVIGESGPVVCIAEGYATAASIHEATGYPVAVAFDSGNLEPVASAIRAKHPTAKIVLCADDDWKTPGNPGQTKATAAAKAVGGIVAIPDFGASRPDGATDFNDLGKAQGPATVKAQIERALAATSIAAPPTVAEDVCEVYARPRPVAVATPWAPLDRLLGGGMRGVNVLVAPTGVGKTGCALQCARYAARTVPVLFASTELWPRQVRARMGAPVLCRGWRDLHDDDDAAPAIARALAGLSLHAIRYTDLATMLGTADAIAAARGTPCMLVVDYLQGAARDAAVDRRIAVGAVIQAITEWSEARGSVALVVSSTARVSYIADDRRGRDLVSTAKEAGEIEYSADAVLYLKSDPCPMDGEAEAQLSVAKARWGSLGDVGLTFAGATGTYRIASAQDLSDLERKVVSAVRAGAGSKNAVRDRCGGRRERVLAAIDALLDRGVIGEHGGRLIVPDDAKLREPPREPVPGPVPDREPLSASPTVVGGSQSGSRSGTTPPNPRGGSVPLGTGTTSGNGPDEDIEEGWS